jgi:hypothetical protein
LAGKPRSTRRAKTLVTDAQALELRKAGASYDQIAAQLGYAQKSGAHHAVKRALSSVLKRRDETAEEMRELELERLDTIQLGIWAQARQGNFQAIDRILRVMERRAAMLGLDAPRRQELTGADGGPIEVDQNVNYSIEERQQRIIAIVDAARARFDPPSLTGRSDLDSADGSTNGRVA